MSRVGRVGLGVGLIGLLGALGGCVRVEPVGLRDAHPLQGMARPGQAAGLAAELDRPAGARERLTLRVEFSRLFSPVAELAVVREKAELARAAGMASMAYTAVYAAAPDFWAAHPDWGLYRQDGRPLEFGDGFLYIMNPAAGTPWRTHLLDQFRRILTELPFDGIHLDQYGDPKYGLAADGTPVDVAGALAGLIDDTRRTVTAERPGARVIFNNVGNWPVRQTAPGSSDAVYIEVWAPYRHFQHLRELIDDGRRLSNGKAVVLAAYIHPQYAASVRLADAAIFASGGYHLELGEGNGMVADPYFPKYGQMDGNLAAALRRYYDFAVRYQELLYAPDLVTARKLEESARLDGARVMNKGYFNLVWAIGRENERHQALHLINLTDLDSADWNAPRTAGPGAPGPQRLTLQVPERPERVYLLSADGPGLAPRELAFDYAAGELSLTLPRLEYWSTLVMVRGA